MDGATRFENFLADVPWEEPDAGMLQEVKTLLAKNFVTRVSHFDQLNVKNLKFDDAPAGATLGMKHALFRVEQFMRDSCARFH
jgi:hypothetical protein